MIEYIAFLAVGLFGFGIVLAIILAEVRWKEEKRADALREVYARQRKRSAAVARRRIAEPSLAPQSILDGSTATTVDSRPRSPQSI